MSDATELTDRQRLDWLSVQDICVNGVDLNFFSADIRICLDRHINRGWVIDEPPTDAEIIAESERKIVFNEGLEAWVNKGRFRVSPQ